MIVRSWIAVFAFERYTLNAVRFLSNGVLGKMGALAKSLLVLAVLFLAGCGTFRNHVSIEQPLADSGSTYGGVSKDVKCAPQLIMIDDHWLARAILTSSSLIIDLPMSAVAGALVLSFDIACTVRKQDGGETQADDYIGYEGPVSFPLPCSGPGPRSYMTMPAAMYRSWLKLQQDDASTARGSEFEKGTDRP